MEFCFCYIIPKHNFWSCWHSDDMLIDPTNVTKLFLISDVNLNVIDKLANKFHFLESVSSPKAHMISVAWPLWKVKHTFVALSVTNFEFRVKYHIVNRSIIVSVEVCVTVAANSYYVFFVPQEGCIENFPLMAIIGSQKPTVYLIINNSPAFVGGNG
jgi:hypothetical protein